METKEKEVNWDDVENSGNYIKFEKGVRKAIQIVDWKLIEKEGKKYESEEMEMKIFFEAKVLFEDRIAVDKIISTSSKPFLNSAKQVLRDKDASVAINLSVKKLGERATTNYDVELVVAPTTVAPAPIKTVPVGGQAPEEPIVEEETVK